MIGRGCLQEAFAYNAWANAAILALVETLDDAALDRPFEMGLGSLRATLNHIYAAERIWLDRWKQTPAPTFRSDCTGIPIRQIADELRATHAEHQALLAPAAADLAAVIPYSNIKGEPFAAPLGEMMLHVANHGVHHRAQALNMLRQLSVELPKPGLDYIFMKLQQPGGGTAALPAPGMEKPALLALARYGDWAMQRLFDAAAGLSDDALDRDFAMGVGGLRATLAHIRFADQWWLENWTLGPGRPFPETEPHVTIADLRRLWAQTVQQRDAYLAGLPQADFARPVTATPRPGVTRVFPLEVTLMQLGFHGTHHRAQALNMLRRLAAPTPGLDYILFQRETPR
jgi:uncharacterized damage-inducible protein DinB